MKLYLVWNHDPGYMTSSLEKIFVDGLKAGEYCREMNGKSGKEWYTIEVRETDDNPFGFKENTSED